jgi:hypothetical protein
MIASRVRPALVLWLLAMLVIVASGWVLLPFPRRPTGWELIVWTIGFGVGFTSVGAVLVDRRPHEPVSRLTLGIGLLVVAAVGLRALAVALDARPGDLPPVGALAATIAQALLILAIVAAGGFLLVRFPNGAESDRLTGVVNGLFALMVGCVVVVSLKPGPIDIGGMAGAANPIGVRFVDEVVFTTLGVLVILAYAVSLGLAVVVIVRRYRRSGPVTRVQIRWVAAASLMPVVLFPFLLVGPEWLWSLWFLSTAAMPIAIGIAILRYRLFDIERIIGRTVAYAVVTALLAALVVGANLLLQAQVADATGANTLTVAVSTLLVAALFQPIRRRVQAPIDRRFNRAHLDAERVVASFARQARDEVDLARLREAVVGVVVEAVRPAGAAIWLRPEHPIVVYRIAAEGTQP